MEYNFVHVDTSQRDFDALFGPVSEGEIFIPFDNNDRLEKLIVDHLKKFKSCTQARKNGWNQEVPFGFKRWKISKTFFYTYRPLPLDPDEDPNDNVKVKLPT